jgi:hypothetical protein
MQSLANKTNSDYYFANGSAGLGINKDLRWTPSAISTALWFDASDSSTITIATGVSQLNDKSGNGRNATQATGANQPLVISNGLNNLNVIRFDGSNDSLGYNGTFFVGTAYSIHAVVTRRSSGTFIAPMAGVNATTLGNLALSYDSNTTFRVGHFGVTTSSTTITGYTNPAPDMWGVAFDTTNGITTRRFGASVGTTGSTSALTSYNDATLGRYGSNYYNGDISEIVATTTTLSTDNRQKLEGYLAWKWGLVSSLPADHPYKNAVPGL